MALWNELAHDTPDAAEQNRYDIERSGDENDLSLIHI